MSLKKTEPITISQNCTHISRNNNADDVEFKVVDKFCYVGSVLSSTIPIDDDISSKLEKQT